MFLHMDGADCARVQQAKQHLHLSSSDNSAGACLLCPLQEAGEYWYAPSFSVCGKLSQLVCCYLCSALKMATNTRSVLSGAIPTPLNFDDQEPPLELDEDLVVSVHTSDCVRRNLSCNSTNSTEDR